MIRNAVLENTWLAEFLTELAGDLREVNGPVFEVQKTAKEQSPPIDAMEVTRTQDGAKMPRVLFLHGLPKTRLPPC